MGNDDSMEYEQSTAIPGQPVEIDWHHVSTDMVYVVFFVDLGTGLVSCNMKLKTMKMVESHPHEDEPMDGWINSYWARKITLAMMNTMEPASPLNGGSALQLGGSMAQSPDQRTDNLNMDQQDGTTTTTTLLQLQILNVLVELFDHCLVDHSLRIACEDNGSTIGTYSGQIIIPAVWPSKCRHHVQWFATIGRQRTKSGPSCLLSSYRSTVHAPTLTHRTSGCCVLVWIGFRLDHTVGNDNSLGGSSAARAQGFHLLDNFVAIDHLAERA